VDVAARAGEAGCVPTCVCSAGNDVTASRGAGGISSAANTSSGSASTGGAVNDTGAAEGGAIGASSSITAVSIFSSPGSSGAMLGGAGVFGGSTLEGGAVNTGRCVVDGVMKRGLDTGGSAVGVAGRTGATGGGSMGCGTALVTTARGGIAGDFPASGGRTGEVEERKAAGGCSFCSMIAFSASPGLDIFDRSILGRSSSELARWRTSRPEPCCSRTYLRTRAASSSSMELE
jgi:hypothetical protein